MDKKVLKLLIYQYINTCFYIIKSSIVFKTYKDYNYIKNRQ